jgi:hypothetical protein
MPKLRRAGQHARADLFKVRRRPSRPQAINAETRSDNDAGDVRRLGGDPIGCHVCAVNVSGKFILDVELASAFILYCVIAVLLNGLLALGWVLWREVQLNNRLIEQVIEQQNQTKK